MTDLKEISSSNVPLHPAPTAELLKPKAHASLQDQAVHDVLHPMRVHALPTKFSLIASVQEDYFGAAPKAIQDVKAAAHEIQTQPELPSESVLDGFNHPPIEEPRLSDVGIDDQNFSTEGALKGVQLSSKEYTRSDLVVYGSQFISGYMGAFDELFQQLMLSVDKQLENDPKKREELQEQLKITRTTILKRFAMMLKEIPLNPAISGISHEESFRYLELQARLEKEGEIPLTYQERQEFALLEKKINEALATTIAFSKEQKKFFKGTKEAIHSLQEEAQKLAQKSLKSCRELVEVEAGVKVPAFEAQVIALANSLRAEMIHARKEWNPKKPTEFDYVMKGVPNDLGEVSVVGIKSSFVAAGPAYSSTMPRNRTHTMTSVANFFKTTASVASGDISFLQPIVATRSATPVEFAQDDKRERAFCTQKHLRQIAEANAEMQIQAAFKNMTPEQRQAVRDGKLSIPVRVNYAALLSPDMGRQLLGMMNKIPLADNERVLLDETLEAANLVNKQSGEVFLSDPDNPNEKMRVKIGYSIRVMNFPGNKLHDAYKALPGISLLVKHSKAEEETNASIAELLKDSKKERTRLLADIENGLKGLTAEEQQEIHAIRELQLSANRARLELSKQLKSQKTVPTGAKLREWQTREDSHALLLRKIASENRPESIQKVAKSMVTLAFLEGLEADIQDLQASGLHDRPEALGGNRYALNSRIVLLSSLLGQGTHFGCRSGKDRTGLLDDQVKLLFGMSAASYRLISFMEEHTHPNYVANRLTVVEEAGNALFNTKANLGGVPWWTIGGCRLDVGTSEEAVRLRQALDEKQSASKLFERPKIKGVFVPAAQRASIRWPDRGAPDKK